MGSTAHGDRPAESRPLPDEIQEVAHPEASLEGMPETGVPAHHVPVPSALPVTCDDVGALEVRHDLVS